MVKVLCKSEIFATKFINTKSEYMGIYSIY